MPDPSRPNRSRRLLRIVLCTALLAAPLQTALALPDDRQQPIKINADQAMRDEKEGLTVYSGNVKLTQGSLYITADRITIYRIVDEADKIVAQGQPATMEQQPDPAKGVVKARAAVIEYYKEEARVHLRENAELEQDGSQFKGETIDYFINEQLFKADSKGPGGVQVLIPAQNLSRSEAASGAAEGD